MDVCACRADSCLCFSNFCSCDIDSCFYCVDFCTYYIAFRFSNFCTFYIYIAPYFCGIISRSILFFLDEPKTFQRKFVFPSAVGNDFVVLLLDGLRSQNPVLLIYIGVEQSDGQAVVDDGLHLLLLATHFLRNVEQGILIPCDVKSLFFVDEAEQGSECGNSCRMMTVGNAAYLPVLEEVDIEREII